MKKFLITGASGFVGRHLLKELLNSDSELHAIARNPISDIPVKWHTLDLHEHRQVDTLIKELHPEILIHLAWYTKHGDFWNSEKNFDWLTTSLRLMQSFTQNGGQRLVVAGSCAEYDWANGVLDEQTTETKPSTLYGKTKYSLYLLVQEYCRQHQISLAWPRLFFMYGPHEDPRKFVASAITKLIQGKTFEVKNVNQIRDFMHIADVAKALKLVTVSNCNGPINIGSGNEHTLGQVAQMIGGLTSTQQLIQLKDNGDQPRKIVAKTDKLSQLGFNPELDLKEGLLNTIDWWKQIT